MKKLKGGAYDPVVRKIGVVLGMLIIAVAATEFASARAASSITLLSPPNGMKVTLPSFLDPRYYTEKIHFSWHIDSCNGGVNFSDLVFGANGGITYQSEVDGPDGYVNVPVGALGSVNPTWHVNYDCIKDPISHDSESRTLVIVKGKPKPKPGCKRHHPKACRQPPKKADLFTWVSVERAPFQQFPGEPVSATFGFHVKNLGPDDAHAVEINIRLLRQVVSSSMCYAQNLPVPCVQLAPWLMMARVGRLPQGETADLWVEAFFVPPAPPGGTVELQMDARAKEHDESPRDNSNRLDWELPTQYPH